MLCGDTCENMSNGATVIIKANVDTVETDATCLIDGEHPVPYDGIETVCSCTIDDTSLKIVVESDESCHIEHFGVHHGNAERAVYTSLNVLDTSTNTDCLRCHRSIGPSDRSD